MSSIRVPDKFSRQGAYKELKQVNRYGPHQINDQKFSMKLSERGPSLIWNTDLCHYLSFSAPLLRNL